MFTTVLFAALCSWMTPADFAVDHPDHGAPFPEQLSGQWLLESEIEGSGQRLRFYEDGRFAFYSGKAWTAGSYFILRSDERRKGVLRLEYYLDGNLHFQEVRCEIHFETHTHVEEEAHDHDHEDGHAHDHEGDHHHEEEGHADEEGHHHEYLRVEVLPAAEAALDMAGEYLHSH